jgi:TIR domain
MADKLIFLSHIHEEKSLALLMKQALEDEFSGFVEVFVSSDGTSIPAGSNFLNRIEDGLINCIGAMYLISPISVKRNWINFELGAVWVRNIVSQRAGAVSIPTLPACHSGMTPSTLPAPLNNLNAITANQASQLDFAFRSLQAAVGGKGKLKTDFDSLARSIISFEQEYTLGANIAKMFSLLGANKRQLIQHCEQQTPGIKTTLDCGFVETSVVQTLKDFESNGLNGHIQVSVDMPGTTFGSQGAVNGAQVKLQIPVSLVLRFKEQLLA